MSDREALPVGNVNVAADGRSDGCQVAFVGADDKVAAAEGAFDDAGVYDAEERQIRIVRETQRIRLGPSRNAVVSRSGFGHHARDGLPLPGVHKHIPGPI